MNDDRVYLTHMLEIARRVRNKVAKVSQVQFLTNEDLLLAVTHLLQTIGEAARLVTEPTRTTLPAIPWRQITGMRHKIVHDYLYVDEDIVWETAHREIPKLIAALEAIRPPLETDKES